MGNSSKFTGIILLLISVLLTSCGKFEDLELRDVSNFKVERGGDSGMAFDVQLKVYNPNKFKITLLEHDLGVSINGTQIGTSKGVDKYTIGKKEEKSFNFSIQTNLSNILGGLLKLLPVIMSNDKVDINIKGLVKGKAAGIKKTFPVDYTTKTDLIR